MTSQFITAELARRSRRDNLDMDAAALLTTVAAAYANLKTLAVELLIANESNNDDMFNRSEQRAKAYFAAPDKLRIEQGNKRGMVTVTNGIDQHHYFARPKRYSKGAAQGLDLLPGSFRPEFPIASGVTFLFSRIAEQVAAAEILREEPAREDGSNAATYVLSVKYETSRFPALAASVSPLLFCVDSKTYLISRVEGEAAHRLPAHDETHINKTTLRFTRTIVNEPIPPETFEFSPPPDALDASDPTGRGGCIAATGGGGGSARFDADRGGRFESWHSHDWAGGTLIETAKLKLHGLDLNFERRLTLSDDRKQLQVIERITAPAGQTEREFSVPVA